MLGKEDVLFNPECLYDVMHHQQTVLMVSVPTFVHVILFVIELSDTLDVIIVVICAVHSLHVSKYPYPIQCSPYNVIAWVILVYRGSCPRVVCG